jgi:hypothetical protein
MVKEHELLLPVRCPVCRLESLSGFRTAVVEDALAGGIRLYANCHAVGWDATRGELQQLREYVDAAFAADLQRAPELPLPLGI